MPQPPPNRGSQSLTRQALVGMAFRIAVIIAVATGVSYWHAQRSLHSSAVQNLSNYVDLRGKAESEQFLLAQRQTRMVRDEFLRRLRAMGDRDPRAEFDRIFVREADGLIRVRPEINDYRHHATAYLRNDVRLTPDLRRRVLIGWQLLDQWGPMLVNRFFSGFMNMPEQLSINFCPTADWGRSATRKTDITIYETVWGATKEKNPERRPFWTTVYYDPGADAWMASCVTPGDDQGRWVVTGGQDVEITDLIRRTRDNQIEAGTWNFIVDAHGNLIAHPNLAQQIAKAGGNLTVARLGDPRLASMVRAVLASDRTTAHTLEPRGLDVLLGVTRISGPDWRFVTVYPKRLLVAQAWLTARLFLAVGLGTLLLELIILAVMLRGRIALPIAQAVTATERISRGDFSVRLDPRRNDELGVLATAVNRMAEAVGERDAALVRQFKELEEARQLQREQQKRDSLGTLAGGIAHDFNNILGAILGYSELALRRSPGDENWRADLAEIRSASHRARDLVKQILTFGRGRQHEKSPVRLSPVVDEALKLLRASLPSTIEIRSEIASEATVPADSSQIHQVVVNLCTNAFQAMTPNGGVLRVALEELTPEAEPPRASASSPGGTYVRLTISDTGCGMDPATLSRIFDPYFTTKEPTKGTGLGLAVARGIVENHDGWISVRSEPAKGATFEVYLPTTSLPGIPLATPAPVAGDIVPAHGRVMLVDDELPLRELLKEVLTRAGYTVDVFANGLEAWQALSQNPGVWDLLVTDQTMPEMTGEQLAFEALALRPRLPIILCTGYSATLNIDQLRRAGVRACLAKPVDLAVLLDEAARALRE